MQARRPRVLIVDDERLIRWSLQQKLAGSGFAARAAGTGEEALRILEEEPADLVLLDVRLPGIDGLEVLRRLKAADPATVVVMLSAGDAVEQAIRCREVGAHDYVVKPFDLGRVMEVIQRALAAGPQRGAEDAPRGREALRPAAERILGRSRAIVSALEEVRRIAGAEDGPVLLCGETGTGKYLFAQALHELGPRAARPLLRVHCDSLPDHLLEYELFGHERGGLAPDAGPRVGLLERAEGGTLLLDEVGFLRPPLQIRLRDLLADGGFTRVGGTATIRADVNFVAGSSQDLARGVRAGWFRADLLDRLSKHVIRLPPLRERREDIPLLVQHFLRTFAARYGRSGLSLSPLALSQLCAWSWPGNVHELRAAIERVVLDADGSVLGPESLPAEVRSPSPDDRSQGGAEARWA